MRNIQKRQNIDYFHMYGKIARMYEIADFYRSNYYLSIRIIPVIMGSNPFPCTDKKIPFSYNMKSQGCVSISSFKVCHMVLLLEANHIQALETGVVSKTTQSSIQRHKIPILSLDQYLSRYPNNYLSIYFF
jgi:hypothetical protein